MAVQTVIGIVETRITWVARGVPVRYPSTSGPGGVTPHPDRAATVGRAALCATLAATARRCACAVRRGGVVPLRAAVRRAWPAGVCRGC
jgi:hypothetical protein